MKLLILLLLFTVPKVGDKMTTTTEIMKGQVWETTRHKGDPFKPEKTIRLTVLDVKQGYVLYTFEIIGQPGILRDSGEVDSFLYLNEGYTLTKSLN